MDTQTLKRKVKGRINTMMEQVLDYTQVAVPNPHGFKAIRSKILRVGNDCMRSIDIEFDKGDTNDRKTSSR